MLAPTKISWPLDPRTARARAVDDPLGDDGRRPRSSPTSSSRIVNSSPPMRATVSPRADGSCRGARPTCDEQLVADVVARGCR